MKKPVKYGVNAIEPISRKIGYERGMPIDRYYIEHFLEEHRAYIKGNVLEIAENRYTKKYGTDSPVSHVLSYKGEQKGDAHMIEGDLTNERSLPADSMDCFICTQTLNFIYDVKSAVRGIRKVIKPGGHALITVSGVSQISRYDYDRWGDYWRFSDQSIRRLLSEYFGEKNVQVKEYGNLAALMALLQGFAVEDLDDRALLDIADHEYQVTLGVMATRDQ